MGKTLFAIAALHLASGMAVAQTKSPESQIRIQGQQPQLAPQQETVVQPTDVAPMRDLGTNYVPPAIQAPGQPAPYRPTWQAGDGFKIVLQENPKLCIYAYTAVSNTGVFAASLVDCNDANINRWVYVASTQHLKPAIAGSMHCLSSYHTGSVPYPHLGLLPCSDKDTDYNNKKWRLAESGKIVNVHNPLICISLGGDGKAVAGIDLRARLCTATKETWAVQK